MPPDTGSPHIIGFPLLMTFCKQTFDDNLQMPETLTPQLPLGFLIKDEVRR
jgi:hypothetical protein